MSLWLYDNLEMRIEGRIVGFDEFMNVTMVEAREVYTEKAKSGKSGQTRELGRILLKGDNIVSTAAALTCKPAIRCGLAQARLHLDRQDVPLARARGDNESLQPRSELHPVGLSWGRSLTNGVYSMQYLLPLHLPCADIDSTRNMSPLASVINRITLVTVVLYINAHSIQMLLLDVWLAKGRLQAFAQVICPQAFHCVDEQKGPRRDFFSLQCIAKPLLHVLSSSCMFPRVLREASIVCAFAAAGGRIRYRIAVPRSVHSESTAQGRGVARCNGNSTK